MRRSRKNNNKVIYIIIAVIVIGFLAGKFLISGKEDKKYIKYVASFEEGIYKYCENDLNTDSVTIPFQELYNILLSRGYVEEYENQSVLLSADDVVITKVNGDISFFNYNNTKTYENSFRIKFNHNNKIYSCTKNKCS